MLNTDFVPVKGYEKYFLINMIGEIFSLRTNKILATVLHKNGYKVFATRLEGRKSKCICLKVHRLVAQTFTENPKNKPFVNHLDGVKSNNNVENLEWSTAKENFQHAVDTGLIDLTNFELANPNFYKLSDEEVEFIRQNYLPRDKTYGARALGRLYNVTHNTIIKALSPR